MKQKYIIQSRSWHSIWGQLPLFYTFNINSAYRALNIIAMHSETYNIGVRICDEIVEEENMRKDIGDYDIGYYEKNANTILTKFIENGIMDIFLVPLTYADREKQKKRNEEQAAMKKKYELGELKKLVEKYPEVIRNNFDGSIYIDVPKELI